MKTNESGYENKILKMPAQNKYSKQITFLIISTNRKISPNIEAKIFMNVYFISWSYMCVTKILKQTEYQTKIYRFVLASDQAETTDIRPQMFKMF